MSTPLPTNTIWTLADGDAAAIEGRWTDAVSIWSALQRGQARHEAEQRLRWFLDQSGHPQGTVAGRDPHAWSLILCAGGLGFLGTAIVLIGESQSGTAATAASIAAWACYLATGVLIVAYGLARYRFEQSPLQLHETDVARALEIARSLDADTDTDTAGELS